MESEEPRGARDLTGAQSLTPLTKTSLEDGGEGMGGDSAEECDSLPRWVDPPDQMESGSPPSWGSPGPALRLVPLLQSREDLLTDWPNGAPSRPTTHLGFLLFFFKKKVLSFHNRIRIPTTAAKGTALGTDATSVNMPPFLVHRMQT